MRVHGNWLETVGRMAIPFNLGTPGARNSRALSNAGPAIFEVTHLPGVPAANEAVVVTARLHDPDGIQSVQLKYRVDPSATYTTLAMADKGAGGDAVANDGIYSATIPGKAAGVVVAFYLQATDNLSVTTRFPSVINDNGPVRECVICYGDPVQPSGCLWRLSFPKPPDHSRAVFWNPMGPERYTHATALWRLDDGVEHR